MKRFYGVLCVATALFSGSLYGMKDVNIKEYPEVVRFLAENGHYVENTKYQSAVEFGDMLSTLLPLIEQCIIERVKNKQDRDTHILLLCMPCLNHYFASKECSQEKIETMLQERFKDKGVLFDLYAPYRQHIVANLHLDKLEPVIKDSKDINAILDWLSIFDETSHNHEKILAHALDKVIDDRGMTSSMQEWERELLQDGKDLQGLAKQHIVILQKKNHEEQRIRQEKRAQAEKRKDEIAGRIAQILKMKHDEQWKQGQLADLVRDEFLGNDAPLREHLEYIDAQVKARINRDKNIQNKPELLNIWTVKVNDVQQQGNQAAVQRQAQEHRRREEQRRIELQRQEEVARREREQRLREVEEQRKQKTGKLPSNRDEQQRQFEEQKRLQREKKQQEKLNWHTFKKVTITDEDRKNAKPSPVPKINLADLSDEDSSQQPNNKEKSKSSIDNDTAKGGIAGLLMSISAPKLVVAAVVVGVCYWGYTKYKAHQEAQKIKEDDKKEQENKQQKAQQQRKPTVQKVAGKRRR